MFFTREDIYKIQAELAKLGVKDSEFPDACTPIDRYDTIVLTQGGRNVKIKISDFLEQLHLLSSNDFLNVTVKFDVPHIELIDAIRIIPVSLRKLGLVITYCNTEGNWEIKQYTSNNLNQWNEPTLWEDCKIAVANSIVPDEEDITAVEGVNNKVIKFKDKNYDPDNYSGMGRVYLRKNITHVYDENTKESKEVNLLTQRMLGKENTIYIIQYDFDLNGEEITIPENCVLKFEGGSFSNGTINFNNTTIDTNKPIFSNIISLGAIKNEVISDYWFNTDNTGYDDYIIRNLSRIASNREKVTIYISRVLNSYETLTIDNTNDVEIYGNTINKFSENFAKDNIAIYIINGKIINIHNIKCSINTIDKNILADDSFRYYCIWCRFADIFSKKVTVNNCIFDDNNGIPYSSTKPYNGCIWIGSYDNVSKNINISNNVFNNCCGRIIYVSNCENVCVKDNMLLNCSYNPNTNISYKQEAICIRLIGCYNNVVTGNTIIMSSQIPDVLHKIINITQNDNNTHNISDHSIISDNIIDISNIPDNTKCTAIYLNKSINMIITNNEIILPNTDITADKYYVLYYNGDNDDTNFIRNIVFKNNTIKNSNRYMFCLFGYCEKGENKSENDNFIITSNYFYTKSLIEYFIPSLENKNMAIFFLKDNVIIENGKINGSYHGCNYIEVGVNANKPQQPIHNTLFFNVETRKQEIYNEIDSIWKELY